MSGNPEDGKRLLVHHQSAALRDLLSASVSDGTPLTQVVPLNVFAMTFATSRELLEEMSRKRMSLVFTASDRMIRMIVAGPVVGTTDFVRALTDGGYRSAQMERWYRALCVAYQQTDERQSYESATRIMADAAVPLGLVADEHGNAISMFDAERPDQALSRSRFTGSMQRSVDHGALDTKESIYFFLSGLWEVMIAHAPEKGRMLADISPGQIAGATPDTLHHW